MRRAAGAAGHLDASKRLIPGIPNCDCNSLPRCSVLIWESNVVIVPWFPSQVAVGPSDDIFVLHGTSIPATESPLACSQENCLVEMRPGLLKRWTFGQHTDADASNKTEEVSLLDGDIEVYGPHISLVPLHLQSIVSLPVPQTI